MRGLDAWHLLPCLSDDGAHQFVDLLSASQVLGVTTYRTDGLRQFPEGWFTFHPIGRGAVGEDNLHPLGLAFGNLVRTLKILDLLVKINHLLRGIVDRSEERRV